MSSSAALRWEELTWPEIPDALAACGQAALLPLGATEQHGPHLGTGTDSCIATHVCAAVSARLRVPLLPTVAYGCSHGHSKHWPGTLSLSPRTLIAVLSEIGEWLHASGVRRLFFISAHVTNAAPMRCALEELRSRFDDLMVAAISTPDISPRVRAVFDADAQDWHANAAETSLLMVLSAPAVRQHLLSAGDDPDRTTGLQFAHPVNRTSQNGTTGFPSQASENAGRELFGWMVDDLSARVRSGLSENPPLTISYTPIL